MVLLRHSEIRYFSRLRLIYATYFGVFSIGRHQIRFLSVFVRFSRYQNPQNYLRNYQLCKIIMRGFRHLPNSKHILGGYFSVITVKYRKHGTLTKPLFHGLPRYVANDVLNIEARLPPPLPFSIPHCHHVSKDFRMSLASHK